MKKFNKQIILIIVLIIILALFLVIYFLRNKNNLQSQAAAGQPTLSLSPSSQSVQINTPFDVDIMIDTGGLETAGVQIAYLHYDPNLLDVIDADTSATGTQIALGDISGAGQGSRYETVIDNNVDKTAGKISFSVGSLSSTYKGSGRLATINFKTKSTTTSNTPVTFDFTSGSKIYTMIGDPLTGANILYAVNDGYYTITNNTTVNITLNLQSGTNFSTSGTRLTIYPTGSRTAATYTKSDITTNNSGQATITFASPPAGNYDYIIKANGYLAKTVANTAISSTLSLNFGVLRAGDIDNDNTIALADFILFRTKWLQSDPISDFDQDGKVTLSDFITLRSNWLAEGDK